MAQTLGVSRGPIREAARELEGQGFLVSRPNQGFYVVDFDAQSIRDVYEAKDWLEAAFVADLARSLSFARTARNPGARSTRSTVPIGSPSPKRCWRSASACSRGSTTASSPT